MVKVCGLSVATLLAILTWFGAKADLSYAHNDRCTPRTGGWACQWYDTNLAPETRHWFTAANTNRNWVFAGIWDGYGGAVARKCVRIKRGSDGTILPVACTHNNGMPDNWIGANKRPGYLFNIHWAPGPRHIGSEGYH